MIIKCFRDTLKEHQFQACKEYTKTFWKMNSTEELVTLDQMKFVKRCMKRTVREFQNAMQGEIINRMFGGECGTTALALMNMIPMPFNQFEKRHQSKKWKETRAFKLMMHLMEKPDTHEDCDANDYDC